MPPSGGTNFIINMSINSIISKLNAIDQQMSVLSERQYQPQISASDQREILKRKKKLEKDQKKLLKRLQAIKNGNNDNYE